MAYGNLSLSPNRCNSAHRDWKHEQGLHSVISLEIRVSATPSCAPETLSSKLEAALQVQAQQLFPKYDWEPRFRILSIRLSNSSPSKPQSREGEAERTRSTAQQRDQHIDNASESPMGRDRIDAPNEDDADQNGLTNARSGASILPTIEVSTTATNEGGSSNSVDRITKEDELLGADKVSMRARQIQRKLLEQIRDGATNFRHNAQTRLGWEDSVELLKPTLKTWPLSVLQERFVRYSQVLGFRKWLTDFLHACATLCAVGDPATSSNITIIRKFVYCVVEPINRLYPIMGNDAFHIITALGAASQPFTKTFAKSCNWDDLVPAVAKLVSQLSKDISWSKLGSQHLIDLPSFLEGPQLSREEIKTLLGLEVCLADGGPPQAEGSPHSDDMFVSDSADRAVDNSANVTSSSIDADENSHASHYVIQAVRSSSTSPDRSIQMANVAREQSEAQSEVDWDGLINFDTGS